MKPKIKVSFRTAPVIRLKTAFIFGASFVILANIAGLLFYFYGNVGNPEIAEAAPPPTNISGVINSYLRVTAVNNGIRTFTADNLSGNISDFQAGRTVMIYQAKGANINTGNSATYGTVTAYNSAGYYEFAIVSSISGTGPYTITVSSMLNSYSAGGALQLISVPSYTDANVTGTVSATAWSAAQGRGGVVAFEVANELTLGASINVSGQGFAGGQAGGNNGDCPDNTTFRSNSNDFGAKGEGISTDGRLYARAPQANAGGGGNPHNAGGGGGSNYSIGGYGGQGWQPGGGCANLNAGGIAGNKFDYASLSGRVFFGGGGGSGQQNNGFATAGANGGGIIVIRAKTIKSSCGGTYGFISDGNSAADANGNDGAGGGGGGGTIVLDVTNYSLTCGIFVRANGGNGGDVNNNLSHGGGGGGGIGIIMETNPTSDPNVTLASTPGSNGTDCNTGACTTPSGQLPETPAFSSLSISNIPGQLITLPIELITFSGKAAGNVVELEWLTASEENNDYFTVERSSNGFDFTAIGNIKGAGTSKIIQRYSTADKGYLPKVTYYRLKQTDYDGQFTYSDVIYVDTRSMVRDIALYPNPASNVVNVTNSDDSPLTVRFVDNRGTLVSTKVVNEPDARLDVSGMEEGIYTVEVRNASRKEVHKLVISR